MHSFFFVSTHVYLCRHVFVFILAEDFFPLFNFISYEQNPFYPLFIFIFFLVPFDSLSFFCCTDPLYILYVCLYTICCLWFFTFIIHRIGFGWISIFLLAGKIYFLEWRKIRIFLCIRFHIFNLMKIKKEIQRICCKRKNECVGLGFVSYDETDKDYETILLHRIVGSYLVRCAIWYIQLWFPGSVWIQIKIQSLRFHQNQISDLFKFSQ